MITTIEYWENGSTLKSKLEDNGDGTGSLTCYDSSGVSISSEELFDLPIQTYPPLDSTGALATLLVVEGLLPIGDAANAIHEEPEHLQHEAEAWSVWV